MSAPQQPPAPVERPLPGGGVLRIRTDEQRSPTAEAAGRALWERLLSDQQQTQERDEPPPDVRAGA